MIKLPSHGVMNKINLLRTCLLKSSKRNMFSKPPSRRPTVLSCNASVATNNPAATNAGIEILKSGGNAADAAVGIAAVLNVVDSGNTGLGGDCFVLFYNSKTKTVKGINGSGRSPSKLSLNLLHENGISRENGCHQIPYDSPFSVTVPGAAAGWLDAVEKFGNRALSLREILNPAITIAENGFPVHELTAHLQNEHSGNLQKTGYSFGDDLLVNGRSPEYGHVVKNPKLANVFKRLATEGKQAIYEGPVAQSIVDTVTSAGGCLTLEDLKEHVSTFEDPISTLYRGIRVWEMPPNGQGIVALIGLNILRGFDMGKEERMSASCLHKMIEATQLAFADASRYVADPSRSDVPVDKLLSEEHAEERRKLIDLNRCASQYEASTFDSGNNTVYFSVVDSQGNACSFINSIYRHNGSGLVPKDCGFILQCRGSNFSLDRQHRNCVEGGKRPYHTIIPGMATYDTTNDLYASFGVMGGFMQPQGHIQVLSSLIDFKMDVQASIDIPRYCIVYDPVDKPVVYLEDGIPDEIILALKNMGHNVQVLTGTERTVFGGAQVIQTKTDSMGHRVLWSGSESRQDGCAFGY